MSATLRVVIDTQLFLRAAINRNSLPAKIIFDLNAYYQLVSSPAIVAEISDVLNRPKLRKKFSTLTNNVVDKVLTELSSAEMVNPAEVPAVSRDAKDDIFLACAKTGQVHYLVSEDADLLILDPYETIRIMNALDFLKVISASG